METINIHEKTEVTSKEIEFLKELKVLAEKHEISLLKGKFSIDGGDSGSFKAELDGSVFEFIAKVEMEVTV